MLPLKLPSNLVNIDFPPQSPDAGYNIFDLSWGGTTMTWGASTLGVMSFATNKYTELIRVKLPPNLISVEFTPDSRMNTHWRV